MTRLRLVVPLVALVVLTGCGPDDRGAAPAAPARTAPAGSGSAVPGGAESGGAESGGAESGGAESGGAESGGPAGSPSPSTLIEFTVDGAGPYQLGTTLDALRGTLDEIKSGGAPCARNTTARGTDTWRDVHLSFRADGLLYLMVNRSPAIPTPSGAWLGTPLAQLKKIYAKIPGQDLANGSRHAYLVTTLSGRGILFDLDIKTAVTAMYAADASYLKNAFATGAYC